MAERNETCSDTQVSRNQQNNILQSSIVFGFGPHHLNENAKMCCLLYTQYYRLRLKYDT